MRTILDSDGFFENQTAPTEQESQSAKRGYGAQPEPIGKCQKIEGAREMETTGMGDMAPAEMDAPSFQLVQSGSVYHTNMDTPEHVPAVGLEAIGRAYAKIMTEAMKVGRQGLLPN